MVFAVVVLGWGGASTAFGGGVSIDHSVVVQPGDTLSEIAAAELSGVSVADGVARLQLANNLSSPQIEAGQTLLVPALP